MHYAFLSYVHADDRRDGGRIRQLADKVSDEIGLLTGEDEAVWVDFDALQLGERWRDKINLALLNTQCLLMIVTPAYFKSTECRREFIQFAQAASQHGAMHLIVPVYYITADAIESKSNADEIAVMLRDIQYIDWRLLRLADADSPSYREGISKLANRVIDARRRAEAGTTHSTPPIPTRAIPEQEPPGLLDVLQTKLPSLERLGPEVSEISDCIVKIGQALHLATAELNSGSRPGEDVLDRIKLVGKLSSELAPLVEELDSNSILYATTVLDVDQLLSALFDHLESNRGEIAGAKGLLTVIAGMRPSMEAGYDGAANLVRVISGVKNLSKDLRPVLRRMEGAIQRFVDTRSLATDWADRAASLLNSDYGQSNSSSDPVVRQ